MSTRPRNTIITRTNIASTAIPPIQAFTLTNTRLDRVVRDEGQVTLGVVSAASYTTPYTISQFSLNPARMNNRLYNLSRNYGKFRFTRAEITIASALPTSVGGSLSAGYCRNPDQEFTNYNQIAVDQVMSLSGSITTQYYSFSKIRASLGNDWYNIDADSEEIMKTTQGKFVILQSAPTNITAEQDIQIFLNYSIEFKEAVNQTAKSNITYRVPTIEYVQDVDGANSASLESTFAFPMVVGSYSVYPPYTIKTESSQGQVANVVKVNSITAGGKRLLLNFFLNEEGLQSGDSLFLFAKEGDDLGPSTYTKLSGN